MDEDTVADLKQFIAAVVRTAVQDEFVEVKQRLTGVEERLTGVEERLTGVEGNLMKVDKKIDDLSAAVAEAIDNANEHTETRLGGHEKRIARLEHRAA